MDKLDTTVEVQRGERRLETVRVRIGSYYGLNLPDGAQIAAMTSAKLERFRTRLRDFPFVMSDDTAENEQAFMDIMLARNTAIVELSDDRGLFVATDLIPGRTASIHALFWDRSLADKIELCRDMLAWLFNTFDLHRVETWLPMLRAFDAPVNGGDDSSKRRSLNDRRLDPLCRAAARFNGKVGLLLEGRFRQAFLRYGEWHDVFVFGLTRQRMERLYGNVRAEVHDTNT